MKTQCGKKSQTQVRKNIRLPENVILNFNHLHSL